MARIFIDGFESGGVDLWDTVSDVSINSASLMDGIYCLNASDIAGWMQKIVSSASEMKFSFLWRPLNATNSKALFHLRNGATYLTRLRRDNSNGHLLAYAGVLVGTGTAVPAMDTTHLIEVYIKIADTGGRYVVKVNGIIDIDFTGDTRTADAQFDRVQLGYDGSYAQCYFDNFIMDDAAWIGNTKIQALVPTGVGNTTGWTPSVGANWECVDEKPASDVDYVSTNVIDITDTYVTENMAGVIDSIKCVQIQSRTKTEGAPTPTNLKLVIRSGAVDYLSGDNAVPATARSFSHLWENNPADSLAWEEADVNAMEIGIKSAT